MGTEGESGGPAVPGSGTGPAGGRAQQVYFIHSCLMGAACPRQTTGTLESGSTPHHPRESRVKARDEGNLSRQGTYLGMRSVGPGSVARSPSSLSPSAVGGCAWPGIVRRFKNKGILAWALLAEGRRGWPCPRPEGHLAGKGGLTQLHHHQHSWECGGSTENRQHLSFYDEMQAEGPWVLAVLSSLRPLRAAHHPHQKLPTTWGHWGDTSLPLAPSLLHQLIIPTIITVSQQPRWGRHCDYH